MGKRNFSIANFAETLDDVSKLDTSGAQEQIEYIDIDLIDDDPKNFYHLSGLEELASNIALLGLQQPLRVRPDPDHPDRVIIVSGHRRRAAIWKLIEEGRDDLARIPCIREAPAQSAALQELRLIYANSDTRTLTNAELSRQAARVEELLYLLKEEGMEFPGRMRDHVAEACRISAPKLARLRVIRENLIPEYMSIFEKDKLPEATAYALARLPADFQKRMASVLSAPPDAAKAEKVLKKYQEGWRWEPDMSCPDGKPCRRGDVFLRRDCDGRTWEALCGGRTCCLDCKEAKSDSYPCEKMCSKAKAQRKAKKDARDEAEHELKQKNGRKYQKETQVYAKRLLRAVDAAGLSDDDRICWRYWDIPLKEIRQWASGEFDDPANWVEAKLVPGRCLEPGKLAQKLGCTADFLLGLTDELRPAATGQQPGTDEAVAADASEPMPVQTEPGIDVRLIDANALIEYFSPFVHTGESLEIDAVMEAIRYAPTIHNFDMAQGQTVLCGWMPGGTFPMEACDVVADFRLPAEEGIPAGSLRRVCWFDGCSFLFGRHGSRIDVECIRWMMLPPVEEVEHE